MFGFSITHSSCPSVSGSPVYYGMSELFECVSPWPQMAVDRRSEFMSALSRVMKKVPTTRDILARAQLAMWK